MFAACAGRPNGVKIAGFRKSGHGVCGESLAFPQFGERIAYIGVVGVHEYGIGGEHIAGVLGVGKGGVVD